MCYFLLYSKVVQLYTYILFLKYSLLLWFIKMHSNSDIFILSSSIFNKVIRKENTWDTYVYLFGVTFLSFDSVYSFPDHQGSFLKIVFAFNFPTPTPTSLDTFILSFQGQVKASVPFSASAVRSGVFSKNILLGGTLTPSQFHLPFLSSLL